MKIRSAWALGLAGALGGWTLRALALTWRWNYVRRECFEEAAARGVIMPFWHNRIIGVCALPLFRGRRTVVMISRHADGELIARAAGVFGHDAVRGSSGAGKGGRAALEELIAAARGPTIVGLTPDGPRGPRFHLRTGLAQLAAATGWPVVPFYPAYARRRVFNSWDRFELPRLGTEITMFFGEPLLARPGEDEEALRLRLEAAMRALAREAEAKYGRVPPPPAEILNPKS